MVLVYCAVDFPIADVVFCATMSNILRVSSGRIYPFISIAFRLCRRCLYDEPSLRLSRVL